MPWQVYNSAGQLLQATDLPDNAVTNAKVANNAIDSAELVAGSVDNAHLADDAVNSDELAAGAVDLAHLSATGTASSSTFLRGDNAWAAAGGGAVAHEGSQTTDAGTTSTSAVDLLSVSSLSIAATTHIWAAASVRQTANSGRVVGFGIKLNTTVISEAESSYNQSDLLWVGEQSVAISGAFLMHMGSRVANFLDGKTRMSSRAKSSTILDLGMSLRADNNMPTATITAVVTRAVCQATAIAAAADEMHVYTLAVS